MKIKELMTKEVGTANSGDSLAYAVAVMWQKDCGAVPIVDKDQRLVGVVTDRDVAIACATRNATPADIQTSQLCGSKLVTANQNESLKKVLKRMGSKRVRRIPITTDDGVLVGIFSISDAINTSPKLGFQKRTIKTLRQISRS